MEGLELAASPSFLQTTCGEGGGRCEGKAHPEPPLGACGHRLPSRSRSPASPRALGPGGGTEETLRPGLCTPTLTTTLPTPTQITSVRPWPHGGPVGSTDPGGRGGAGRGGGLRTHYPERGLGAAPVIPFPPGPLEVHRDSTHRPGGEEENALPPRSPRRAAPGREGPTGTHSVSTTCALAARLTPGDRGQGSRVRTRGANQTRIRDLVLREGKRVRTKVGQGRREGRREGRRRRGTETTGRSWSPRAHPQALAAHVAHLADDGLLLLTQVLLTAVLQRPVEVFMHLQDLKGASPGSPGRP